METIKRKIELKKKSRDDLERIGYSSSGVLTFIFKDKNGTETLLNFDEKELNKLRNFLRRFNQ